MHELQLIPHYGSEITRLENTFNPYRLFSLFFMLLVLVELSADVFFTAIYLGLMVDELIFPLW
jgi:hypothetical protein